jgi:SAM-dependent methyltransferase
MTESHGGGRRASEVAAVLAGVVAAAGRPVVVLTRGPREEAAAVVAQLRRLLGAAGTGIRWTGGERGEPAGRPDPEPDVVVECRDPDWPVVRYVRPPLPWSRRSRLRETQAFFAVRAQAWDTKFGDDLPAYRAAVIQAGFPTGGRVADVGCGTGRALPALRAAVGPAGVVLAVDVTVEMLRTVRQQGRERDAVLLLADAGALPLADAALDGVFAAGLVSHLHDPVPGMAELARVTRDGGRLALFHPSGREALAARHGRVLEPDEPLARGVLGPLLAAAGWRLDRYDDGPDRFLALATRTG